MTVRGCIWRTVPVISICRVSSHSLQQQRWICRLTATTAMWCPCKHCRINKKYSSSCTVHAHLIIRGFMDDYRCWNKHGEGGVNDRDVQDSHMDDMNEKGKLLGIRETIASFVMSQLWRHEWEGEIYFGHMRVCKHWSCETCVAVGYLISQYVYLSVHNYNYFTDEKFMTILWWAYKETWICILTRLC